MPRSSPEMSGSGLGSRLVCAPLEGMTSTTKALAPVAALALTLTLGAAPSGADPTGPDRVGSTTALDRAPAAARLAPKKWEKRVLKLTNKQRKKHDCRTLKMKKPLRKAARKHSKRMAAAGNLSHQLPGEPGLGNRVTAAGYRNWRGVAENIAYGYPTPKSMVKAWMDSPGHRQNILNCDYRHLGVGVTLEGGTPWATQDFGHK